MSGFASSARMGPLLRAGRLLVFAVLLQTAGAGHGHSSIRGGHPQWLGRSKGAKEGVNVRPSDLGAGAVRDHTFEHGEGPGPRGASHHDGRGDHTELLDLTDYTKTQRKSRGTPKGFHMPGEKKPDGVSAIFPSLLSFLSHFSRISLAFLSRLSRISLHVSHMSLIFLSRLSRISLISLTCRPPA